MNTITIHSGDNLEIMRDMDAESVDAVVTDPPAGIAFMGKDWDKDKGGRTEWVAWMTEVMGETLRLLKPGGHALVWALPRTSHWTAWALEEAGFEIRDCVYHVFGSGFPKSHNISKAIDKMKGAERGSDYIPTNGNVYGQGKAKAAGVDRTPGAILTHAPATPEAEQWDGWGTALKPAVECWWLVRKPFPGTVAGNVLEWGTGGINVDGCRVEAVDENYEKNSNRDNVKSHWGNSNGNTNVKANPQGRFPANFGGVVSGDEERGNETRGAWI